MIYKQAAILILCLLNRKMLFNELKTPVPFNSSHTLKNKKTEPSSFQFTSMETSGITNGKRFP